MGSVCFAEYAFCEYLQCVRAPQRTCTAPTSLLITDPSVACMVSDCEGASQPFSVVLCTYSRCVWVCVPLPSKFSWPNLVQIFLSAFLLVFCISHFLLSLQKPFNPLPGTFWEDAFVGLTLEIKAQAIYSSFTERAWWGFYGYEKPGAGLALPQRWELFTHVT